MFIPPDIKAFPRPTCTSITYVNGNYYVQKYTSKRVMGKKNPIKVYVGTIGKIDPIKGFIPNTTSVVATTNTSHKIFGSYYLFDKLSKPLFDRLCKFYDIKTSKQILVLGLLRLLSYYNVYSNLKKEYDYSYLSLSYPDVPLSKDTITKLLNELGGNRLSSFNFMRDFIDSSSKYIIIDGTKIINDSITNGSSKLNINNTGGFSKQVKVLFSFDSSSNMPVFFKGYRGNVLDKTAFLDYIEEAGFNNNSCLVTDKGFNDIEAIEYLKMNNIPYLIPLKRNSLVLRENIQNQLTTDYFYYEEDNTTIWFYKETLTKGYRYYFKNSRISERETTNLYKNMLIKNQDIKLRSSNNKINKGGVIVFESNMNVDPIEIYKLYTSRWLIETFYKDLKSINNFGTINVQGDNALFGNQFITFISMYMFYTFINHIKSNTPYFGVKSIKSIISDLNHLQITRKTNGTYKHETLTKKDKTFFESLGIVWCKC